jgi:hypothetical protein
MDTIIGGNADDILIGGSTIYDQNFAALQAILAEWQSALSYADRIARIRAGVGPDGSVKLVWGTTVVDDLARDILLGNGGLDWFFASTTGPGADVTDRNAAAGEQLN